MQARWALDGSGGRLVQCLLQVRQQVVHVLAADGQPDESFADALCHAVPAARLRVHAGVGEVEGQLSAGLHAAEAHAALEQGEAADSGSGDRGAARATQQRGRGEAELSSGSSAGATAKWRPAVPWDSARKEMTAPAPELCLHTRRQGCVSLGLCLSALSEAAAVSLTCGAARSRGGSSGRRTARTAPAGVSRGSGRRARRWRTAGRDAAGTGSGQSRQRTLRLSRGSAPSCSSESPRCSGPPASSLPSGAASSRREPGRCSAAERAADSSGQAVSSRVPSRVSARLWLPQSTIPWRSE